LPYFETRRRSGCNDFGYFCTDQNIHMNQDQLYWLLPPPPYTSYDYFSSDLRWSQDRSWRGLGAVAPVSRPPSPVATPLEAPARTVTGQVGPTHTVLCTKAEEARLTHLAEKPRAKG